MEVVPVCAKFEEELAALEPDEAKAFLDDIGATESGLPRVIRTGYKLLDYCTFFTTGKDDASKALIDYAAGHGMEVVPVCAKFEEELAALEPDDAKAFLEDIGATESGLQRVIRTGYKLLDYCTFFTTGKDETRAWTIVNGMAAPEAAGKIHTDMQHGFIRMEVVSYEELVAHGGWNAAKTAGKLRTEGKDYIVKDGDCVYVLFNK